MANPKVHDDILRHIIDVASSEPGFGHLSQEDQDSTIQRLVQHHTGAIPGSEGLLQNVAQKIQSTIQQSRMGSYGGSSPLALLPSNGGEALDTAKVVGRQIPGMRGEGVGFTNQGPFGIGMNLSGIKKTNDIIGSPQTKYGKNLEGSADNAQLATMAIHGIPALAEGLNKFYSTKGLSSALENLPTSQAESIGNIKNQYGSETPYIQGKGKIGQNIQEQQNLKGLQGKIKSQYQQKKFQTSLNRKPIISNLEKNVNDFAVQGSRQAEEALATKRGQFVEEFGNKLKESKSKLTNEHFGQALKDAAIEHGAEKIPGTPGHALMSEAKDQFALTKTNKKGTTVSRLYTPEEAQALSKRILSSLPDTKSKSMFYKNFIDQASNLSPGLVEAKTNYKPLFDLSEKAKNFLESGLKKMSKSSYPDTMMAESQAAEKELGLNLTGKAKDFASKRGELAKAFKIETNDLNQMRDKELSGVYEKLNKLKNEKPELIHEARQKIEMEKAKFETSKNKLENEISKKKFRQKVTWILGGLGASALGIKHYISKVRDMSGSFEDNSSSTV